MAHRHPEHRDDEGQGRWQSWLTAARDVMLLLGGLAGIGYETVVAPRPDPELLALFAGMIGLPAVLRRD